MRRFINWLILNSVILAIGISNSGYAVTADEQKVIDTYGAQIDYTIESIKYLGATCKLNCEPVSGTSAKASPACRKTYADFFKIKGRVADETKEDSVINISLAFGYIDYKNGVEDKYAAIAFGEKLLQPCGKDHFACGFKQNPDDSGLLQKQIKVMGPDGIERTRTVEMRMRYSSHSADERTNRGQVVSAAEKSRCQTALTSSKSRPEFFANCEGAANKSICEKKSSDEFLGACYKEPQTRRTETSKQFFADALRNSDMVMYVGHARAGGGPDFGPPVIHPQTKRTYFDWYCGNYPGVNLMHGALTEGPDIMSSPPLPPVSSTTAKGAWCNGKSFDDQRKPNQKQPKIIGMFACFSKEHFKDQLRKDAPQAGLILSGDTAFEESVGQAFASLDSVLGMRCENEFQKAANVNKFMGSPGRPDYMPLPPLMVDGLFK